MFSIESRGGAIACLAGGLVLFGLWPSVWALVERRGRIPSHTFLDYGISYTAITIAVSAALGSVGAGQPGALPFGAALRAADPRLAALAAAGGALVAATDVLLQYGVAFLGVAVGPPAFCALSLLTSAVVAYLLDGRRNTAALLFPGVAAALAAIALGAAAHFAVHAARAARAATVAAGGGGGAAAGCEADAETGEGGGVGGAGHYSSSSFSSSSQADGTMAAAAVRSDSRAPLQPVGLPDSAGGDAPAAAAAAVGVAAASAASQEAGMAAPLLHPAHRVLQTPTPGSAPPSPRTRGAAAASPPPLPSPALAPVVAPILHPALVPHDKQDSAQQLGQDGSQLSPRRQQPQQHPKQAAAAGLRQRRTAPRPPRGHDEPTGGRAIAAADSPAASTALLGFAIVAPAALLNSASYACFVAAVKDAPGVLPPGAPRLGVYPAAALYAAGFAVATVAVSAVAMAAPPLGTQRSSPLRWARDWRGRALCVLSGALTAGGDILQFMGGDSAGYAAALMVQAHPLVGMAVSALALRELRGVGWRAAMLVCAQAGAYAGSVALLAASAA